MKLDFKKVMSSVLAFVMLFSSLVMVNVVSVSAATYSFGAPTVTNEQKTKTWDFTSNTATDKLKIGDIFDGITVGGADDKVKGGSEFLSASPSATISIPVPANCEGTIQFVGNASNVTSSKHRYATVEGDTNRKISMIKPADMDASGVYSGKDTPAESPCTSKQSFTTADTSDSVLGITFASGEFKISQIIINLTTGEFPSATTYTLSGKCEGIETGKTFELTDGSNTYTVTVGEGGTYSASNQSAAYVDGNYTAKAQGYTASYKTDDSSPADNVVLTTEGTATTVTNTVVFAAMDLEPLDFDKGTYAETDIQNGMPYFDLSESTQTPKNKLHTDSDKIAFKLSEAADVTIELKSNSSDTTKTVKAVIYKEGSPLETSDAFDNTGGSFKVTGLAAGTYKLGVTKGGTSSTDGVIKSITISRSESSVTSETSSETTSKEEVDETSSETTTAAPVSGDCVAVPYNIKFNKTTGDAGEKMNAAGITELKGATLDNIEYNLSSSYALKNGAPSADYIKVKQGSIKFSVDQSVYLKIDIVNSNRTLNIKDATGKTYGPITDINDTEAILIPAGSYTLSDTGSEVQISEIDISPAKTYKVKISGNNELSNEVTVSIADKTFQAAAGSYEASLELAAGTHELSAPGCMFDPHEITVKDQEEEQSFTVNIKESKTVTVKFNFSEGSADPKDNSGSKAAPITITNLTTNESKEIKTKSDVAEFTDVAPKTAFKFTSLSANTWKFLSRRADVVDTSENHDWKADIGFLNGKTEATRYFVYTVPNTVTSGTEYGVEFTAEEDIRGFTLAGNRNSQGNAMTSGQTLSFGQYGFGQDKVNSCGKDARDYVDYVFEVAGLNDYINGRYSADIFVGKILPSYGSDAGDLTAFSQYGILNEYQEGKDTYIRFKVSSELSGHEKGKIKALVDDAGDITVYDITDESGPEDHDHNSSKKVTVTDVTGTSKQSFVIEADHVYEIIADTSDTSHSEYYIKSIRILNPDNIFDTPESDPDGVADGENKVTGYKEASIPAEIKAALDQQPASGATLFRVIGQITLSGDDAKSAESASAALSNIKAVGFDMFEKDYYDANDTNAFVADSYHLRGDSTTKNEAPITYTEIVAADDIVNTAVDLSTDQSQIIGSTAPSSFDKVYCQTFIATSTSKVLVPWVKYVTDPDTKVYTLVPITETSPDKLNNIVLDINKAS